MTIIVGVILTKVRICLIPDHSPEDYHPLDEVRNDGAAVVIMTNPPAVILTKVRIVLLAVGRHSDAPPNRHSDDPPAGGQDLR